MQNFNLSSLLFCVFKDIAVAQKNYLCHSLHIPLAIVQFSLQKGKSHNMAPSVYHIIAHLAPLILDRAGFIERFVQSEPGTIALAMPHRAEWLHLLSSLLPGA